MSINSREHLEKRWSGYLLDLLENVVDNEVPENLYIDDALHAWAEEHGYTKMETQTTLTQYRRTSKNSS